MLIILKIKILKNIYQPGTGNRILTATPDLDILDDSLPTRYFMCLTMVADMDRLSNSAKEESFRSGNWSPAKFKT